MKPICAWNYIHGSLWHTHAARWLAASAVLLAFVFAGEAAAANDVAFTLSNSRPTINRVGLLRMKFGETVAIATPDQPALTVTYERLESGWKGTRTWVGKVANSAGPTDRVFITFTARGALGLIDTPNGTARFTEDAAKGFAWLPQQARTTAAHDPHTARLPATRAKLPYAPERPNTMGQAQLDLAIVMTPEFNFGQPPSVGGQGRVDQLVAVANSVFIDSGVNITLKVAAVSIYSGNTGSNEAMLKKIGPGSNTSAAVDFKRMRDAAKADAIVFFRKYLPEHAGCGRGYVGGLREQPGDPLIDLSGESDAGYAIVSETEYRGPCDETSLAHEIGHILGSMHDRVEDFSVETGAFRESFGHKGSAGGGFYTVMGYPDTDHKTIVRMFSNPAGNCYGVPCGIADGGHAADNRRRFNDVRFKVAGWKGSPYHALNLKVFGVGEGSIRASSYTCSLECTIKFVQGSTITLTPVPGNGARFVGWAGACTGTGPCQVTIGAEKTVSAQFLSKIYYRRLDLQVEGGTLSTIGMTCTDACAQRYELDSKLVVTATPRPGYEFQGWSQPGCFGLSCQVTMDADKAVSAKFGRQRVTSISAGGSTSFVVLADGTLWAWGNHGALGVDLQTSASNPVLVGTGYESVWAGNGRTFAIRRDGTLVGWGGNSLGELGDGTNQYRNTPVPIGSGFLVIGVGERHTLGVKGNGETFAWGWNTQGQFGNGSQAATYAPISTGNQFAMVTATGDKSFGIKSNGTLWAWGSNETPYLGDGTYINRLSPVQIASGVENIRASYATYAVRQDSTLLGWGPEGWQQVDDGQAVNPSPDNWHTPVVLGKNYAVVQGGPVNLAVKTNGDLMGWGRFNNTAPRPPITPVRLGTGFMNVSGGSSHHLALKNDGTLWGVGGNSSGELGIGNFADQWTAVRILVPGD